MRSRIPYLIALPVAALALAGCGSAAGSPAPSLPAAEQAAITAMAPYCTQGPAQLASMVSATHQLEVKAGIKDETETQLAQHLVTVVKANASPISCVDEFAAYLTLREG